MEIPAHLKKYVVVQKYERYTPEDQAVWRYVMRQLKYFLKQHAHPCYEDGLEKTGVSLEEIPKIENMDKKLNEFGWGAVPVSGFIPPAAFMEFQSLGILPIASDMRTLDHLLYTPAPDIVHEAAGHAPILVDPKFAAYLKRYAVVASHAIISKDDMQLYEAIRILSDVKENPESTVTEIETAESHLSDVSKSMRFVSEAGLLSRMNWWTAEYGLIGSIDSPKIFGAGLLSSVGESTDYLQESVKKIPLSIDCVKYNYDITEPQPQLFVTETFDDLISVLDEFSETMAYKKGGAYGLDRAIEAETVNTTELNSGLQISGILSEYLEDSGGNPIFIKFSSPSQLSFFREQLDGHSVDYHSHGYSTPVGTIKGRCLTKLEPNELNELGLIEEKSIELSFDSGVVVSGKIKSLLIKDGCLLLISFEDCTVKYKDKTLFEPSWGTFDMGVGSEISSVFGGPSDRQAYGITDDFVASRVPQKNFSDEQIQCHNFYKSIREARLHLEKLNQSDFEKLFTEYLERHTKNWLMGVELLEMAHALKMKGKYTSDLIGHLNSIYSNEKSTRRCIEDGIKIADQYL